MKSFNRKELHIKPLSERTSKIGLDDIVEAIPEKPSSQAMEQISELAEKMNLAKKNKAPIVFAFGAHLIKNKLSPKMIGLMERGYVQHMLGNGAVAIHDWEFAYQGATTEDVKKYVSEGQFGIWEETGKYMNMAINAGAKKNLGLGESLGKMIQEESIGMRKIAHPYKKESLLGEAYRRNIPFGICVGIGQDIIQTHPECNGAALGKTSYEDFLQFAETIKNLEGGVFVSIGSAVMSPMVFEKSLSMAKNIAIKEKRKLEDYHIVVNDIQPSNWNWSKGEPKMDCPDYYLRFFKTFNRMGGTARYVNADNKSFLHYLTEQL